ncbi:MAG: ureidoglycolate dehydrogenase (NAD+) [Sphingobacteriales bacterium]|jgi:ureidoglycolate dehydrogenase (NAD+)
MSLKLDHKILSTIMLKNLQGIGVCDDSANYLVESIIQTSLRGVDSHGINLYPHYCQAFRSGRINPNPSIKINQSASSIILVDADSSIGHHSGSVAMEKAIEIAKSTGIAAVNVNNSNHFGAAAYFGLKAAEKNCLGFAFTNADALVKVTGSSEMFFGTNPICFTAPLKTEEPFCLDLATSLVSYNKIKNYRMADEPIPDGWGFTKKGEPTKNPHEVVSLNPIGDYKGYGLGMMIDILCAILGSSVIGKDMLPMFNTSMKDKRFVSHFFMVIDIEKFLPLDNFKNNLQSMVDRLRQLPKTVENQNVMVPGDPEKKTFKIRNQTGIPISKEYFNQFLEENNQFNKALL